MPMRPGIHISNPADFEDDGDDRTDEEIFADKRSAAERIADMRAETDKARSRRSNARRPKSLADIDTAAIYAKFNAPKPGAKLGAGADED